MSRIFDATTRSRSGIGWASRAVVVIAVALLCSLGLSTTSSADPSTPQPAPVPKATATGSWTRYPAQPFTLPAGDLCRFPLASEPVFDQVYVRTTQTFANGKPRRQEFSGPLQVRLTNVATSRSIVRDLSGYAVATYRADGGYDFSLWGPAAVGFRPGDTLPRGFYRLTGHHVIRFAADGTRTVLVDQGAEHNLCRDLS